MSAELFRRGLVDSGRSLLGWCVGVAAYVILIAAIFPSIESSPEFDELIERYPDALKNLFGITEGGDFRSGAGFLDIELFGLMLPLLVLVLAIGAGARTLAGEEDAGRLELVLAHPLPRRDAVFAKGSAVAVTVAIVCAAAGVAILVFDPLVGLELSLGRLAAAIFGVAVLGVFHGWLALAVGGAVPSRALAIGVPAAVGAAGYLVSGLYREAEWLEPFRFASPFWLIGSSPLQNGIDAAGTLVVAVAAVVALVAGALLLERGDLQTP
jgi:beta-exotoxin I transport system permease protein